MQKGSQCTPVSHISEENYNSDDDVHDGNARLVGSQAMKTDQLRNGHSITFIYIQEKDA